MLPLPITFWVFLWLALCQQVLFYLQGEKLDQYFQIDVHVSLLLQGPTGLTGARGEKVRFTLLGLLEISFIKSCSVFVFLTNLMTDWTQQKDHI